MTVAIDPAWALSVFLVNIRLGVVFLLSPILAGLGGLVTVRVLLTLGLSAAFVAGAGPFPLAGKPFEAVLVMALAELVTGGVLAFGLFSAFAAFSVAGKLLDIQSGFAIGGVYDPVTGGGSAVFALMFNMLAVVAFFGLDAHHALMRGLAFSLEQVPPGTMLSALPIDTVVGQFGMVFSLGLALIVPVLLCLLLVELGLAVISRVLPQMSVFIVLVPVKVITAIILFALTIAALKPAMAKVFASIFTYWEAVLS